MSNFGFCDQCDYKFTDIDVRLHCPYGEDTLCYDCAYGVSRFEESSGCSLDDSQVQELYEYINGSEDASPISDAENVHKHDCIHPNAQSL